MEDEKVAELKGLLTRHGQQVLDEPARFESLLKDTALSPPERSAVFAAIKLGIPQRLREQPGTEVPATVIARLADRLSQEMALRPDAARAGVEIWARALGRDIPAAVPPSSSPAMPPPSPQPSSVTQSSAAASAIGTPAQPNTGGAKKPLPTGLLVATILVILQTMSRAGFLLYGLTVNSRFLDIPSYLIFVVLIPVLLLILSIVMVVLIVARSAAAKPFGITVCILNIVIQVYGIVRLISFYSSYPAAISAITITIVIAYLAVFTLALIFLIRWTAAEATGRYPSAAPSTGRPA
jgi:hypothetical protein